MFYRPVPTTVKDRPIQRTPSGEEQGGSQDFWQVLSTSSWRRSERERGGYRGHVFLFCLLIHVVYARAKMTLRRCQEHAE